MILMHKRKPNLYIWMRGMETKSDRRGERVRQIQPKREK